MFLNELFKYVGIDLTGYTIGGSHVAVSGIDVSSMLYNFL